MNLSRAIYHTILPGKVCILRRSTCKLLWFFGERDRSMSGKLLPNMDHGVVTLSPEIYIWGQYFIMLLFSLLLHHYLLDLVLTDCVTTSQSNPTDAANLALKEFQPKDGVAYFAFIIINGQFGFFSSSCCLLHDRKITIHEPQEYSGRIGFSRTRGRRILIKICGGRLINLL